LTRSGQVASPDLDAPSLAVLLDNARTALVAGRRAGIPCAALLVSQADFDTVAETKRRELRNGLGLRIFGLAIFPRAGLGQGMVLLASPDEL
jgi:hypothetical protein